MELVVDTREYLLIEKLLKNKIQFKKKQLPVFDLIIGDYGFELKCGNDFLLSIYDNRIFTQIKKMKKTNLKSFILIYNSEELYKFAKNRNVITGLLFSLSFGEIPVIQVGNIDDVIYIIRKILRNNSDNKKRNRDFINLNLNHKSLFHRKISAISCAKSIGINGAISIIRKFKTIKNIIENFDSVTELKNFNKKKVESLRELLFL